MTSITLEEFESRPRAIMEQLRGGEEIIVTVDSQPLARVSGIAKNNSRMLKNSFAGKIWTAPDFDAPLEEFEDVDA